MYMGCTYQVYLFPYFIVPKNPPQLSKLFRYLVCHLRNGKQEVEEVNEITFFFLQNLILFTAQKVRMNEVCNYVLVLLNEM